MATAVSPAATPVRLFAPAEARRIRECLRLGWVFAELRGRLRESRSDSGESVTSRVEHALPLALERTPAEQAIETEAIVKALADRLALDVELRNGSSATPASEQLTSTAIALRRARADDSAWTRAWDEATDLFYRWDARIQDSLASASIFDASAYQLGRALAETSWALDPGVTEPDDPRSAAFLLGSSRCAAIHRLLERVEPLFRPLTVTAVEESLAWWHEFMTANDGVPAAVAPVLREQARLWRDLVVADRDPTSLVPTATLLRRARSIRPVLRSFWPELAAGGAGAAVLAAGGALLVGPAPDSLGAVLAVLGFFGVTGSGLLAKAKDRAHALLDELRLALYRDVIATATTIRPDAASPPQP